MTQYQNFNFDIILIRYFTKYHHINIDIFKMTSMYILYKHRTGLIKYFWPPFEKSCRGAPVPGGGCTSRTWSYSSACKNLGAQHPV